MTGSEQDDTETPDGPESAADDAADPAHEDDADPGDAADPAHEDAADDTIDHWRNLVRGAIIGAVTGALAAVLLGIPSFTADSSTQEDPFMVDWYCDLSRWTGECDVNAGGTMLLMVIFALVGAIIGYTVKSLIGRQSDL